MNVGNIRFSIKFAVYFQPFSSLIVISKPFLLILSLISMIYNKLIICLIPENKIYGYSASEWSSFLVALKDKGTKPLHCYQFRAWYLFENFTNLSNVFFSPWVCVCLRIFQPFRILSLVCSSKAFKKHRDECEEKSAAEDEERTLVLSGSLFIHVLWLDLIRVTRCDQTCISVTVMVEVDPTPPLAATLHSSSGGQKTCVSKFFRFDCFPQRQFQLIRNPKMVHWDLEDLLPLLNKSTANNFSDLCVKELYPWRVLNKNWQKKKIR